MGRFSVEKSMNNPMQQNQQPAGGFPAGWPTVFPKETIGIERNGVIVKHDEPIYSPDQIEVLPGSLEAIKMMRLKGYRVVIFFNEPLIGSGKLTPSSVDATNQRLMEIFGQFGILTIDGLLYSTTNLKDDIFSMPNNGMMKKAERDFNIKFKGGYFVGDKLYDLKAGDSVNAKPVLVRTGSFGETMDKLNTFANRELKSKVKIYENLLDFANQLD